MPAKNTLKTYIENGYYHIYSRGVEKRQIFLNEDDCVVFLHYFKNYLSPLEELMRQKFTGMRIQRIVNQNISKEIDLLAFALMPNHIHLLIKQYTRDGIIKFMRKLLTGYAMFFNKKYKRKGTLFESRYKALLVQSDPYLLHLSRYIHLNSIESKSSMNFIGFSSYPYYLGRKNASWIKPQEILNYFKNTTREDLKDMLSYQSFIEDYKEDSTAILGDLILETS